MITKYLSLKNISNKNYLKMLKHIEEMKEYLKRLETKIEETKKCSM